MPTTFLEAKFKNLQSKKSPVLGPAAASADVKGGGGASDVSAGAAAAADTEDIDDMVQWKYSGRTFGWSALTCTSADHPSSLASTRLRTRLGVGRWLYDDKTNEQIERFYQRYLKTMARFGMRVPCIVPASPNVLSLQTCM
jgi:hypothetical protein